MLSLLVMSALFTLLSVYNVVMNIRSQKEKGA